MFLETTEGRLRLDAYGMILPHEHIFVDLRSADAPGFGEAAAADVVRLMAPELRRAKASGVGVLVECTPEGVGRRADLVCAAAREAGLAVVLPTGIYREPWVPGWARDWTEEQLYSWMLKELSEGIAGTDMRAGWIKLSAGDEGMTPLEEKILRAAGRAGKAAGVAIGSHTVRGSVVWRQLEVLAETGYPAERFISIHAQAEGDFEWNLRLAEAGVWLEYDNLGWGAEGDDLILERVLRLREKGFLNRLLLSHDAGWYDPGKPGGGKPLPFTHLVEQFLPRLRAAGLAEEEIRVLTRDNPFRAFARED